MTDFSGPLTIALLIAYARETDASDIHITAALPPVFRRNGQLRPGPFDSDEQKNDALIREMLNEEQVRALESGRDLDFGFAIAGGLRQRVNVYRQQGRLAAAIRILRDTIPTMEDLGLPPVMRELAEQPRGLILVTGPTGSGKSTTLAAMVDYINQSRKQHIITIEDPVEYIHAHRGCVVHQRELHKDVASFADALRSAMREDPDVILVGEMRDFETISAAVTAAETGHLVLSTLHTTGAAQTLDRIVDVYPPHAQGQIRSQLSGVLRGIISQVLVPRADGSGRVAATEILTGSDAVLNLVREGKYHQLSSVMQSNAALGMHTLASDLAKLVRKNIVTRDDALAFATSGQEFEQYLGLQL